MNTMVRGTHRHVALLGTLAALALSAIFLVLFLKAHPSRTFPDVGISAGGSLQTWSLADVDRQLDDYLSLHAHWIRFDFAWDAVEYRKGVFAWRGSRSPHWP